MQLQYFSLLIAALLASATAINKIKCYSCSSETDINCNDPINTEILKAKECTSDVTNSILGGFNTGLKDISNFLGLEKTPQLDVNFVCIKASYSQTIDGKEKKSVVRSCSIENAKICQNVFDKKTETNNMFCEECKSDECNGSSSVQGALFIIVPALAMLWASRY